MSGILVRGGIHGLILLAAAAYSAGVAAELSGDAGGAPWANSDRDPVGIDLPLAVACPRTAEDGDEPAAEPLDRRRASFEVSTLLDFERGGDVVEVAYRFSSPSRSFRIVDFQPRTLLGSDYAGNLAFEEKSENSRSAGFTIGTNWHAFATGGLNADAGTKKSSSKRYELTAPQTPVVSSGTIDHGHGVLIKLRPSRQRTLEGTQPFQLTLHISPDWRGDLMHVAVEARLRSAPARNDSAVRVVRRVFTVALFADESEQARAAAELFQRRLMRLQAVALRQAAANRDSRPSSWMRLDQLISPPARGEQDAWWRDVLHGSPEREIQPRLDLAADVQTAAQAYLAAKRAVHSLRNGTDGETATAAASSRRYHFSDATP